MTRSTRLGRISRSTHSRRCGSTCIHLINFSVIKNMHMCFVKGRELLAPVGRGTNRYIIYGTRQIIAVPWLPLHVKLDGQMDTCVTITHF